MKRRHREALKARLAGLEERQAARLAARQEGKKAALERLPKLGLPTRPRETPEQKAMRTEKARQELAEKIQRVREKLLGQPVEATA